MDENAFVFQMQETLKELISKVGEMKVELAKITEKLENSDIVSMSQEIKLLGHKVEEHLVQDKEEKSRFWDVKKTLAVALLSIAYNVYTGVSNSKGENADKVKQDVIEVVKEIMSKP